MRTGKFLTAVIAAVLLSTATNAPDVGNCGLSIVTEAASKLKAPEVNKPNVIGNKTTLSWKYVSGAKGYIVYKYDSASRRYTVYRYANDSRTCKITGLEYNTTYRFKVAAYVIENGRRVSQEKSAAVTITTQKLDAPTRFKAKTDTNSILLSWDKVADASAYRVYFYDPAGKKLTKYCDVTSNECEITGLKSGSKYYFKVSSLTRSDTRYKEQSRSAVCEVSTLSVKDSTKKLQTADFTVYDGNGKKVSLSDFAGKPIIVNLWATWCGPCRSELPHFDKFYKQYGNEINFLMVDVWEDKAYQSEVVSFIKESGYTFPVYYDYNEEAVDRYNVDAIPVTLVIDRNGNLVKTQVGSMSEQALKSLIDMIR